MRRTIDDLLVAARARLERVTAAEAHAAQLAGSLLVDTRTLEQRARTGLVPGAHVVGLNVLEWRFDPTSGASDPALADPAAHVILLCQQGYSSSLAAARLQDLGFQRATDVIGGFEAWREAGLPVAEFGARPGRLDVAVSRRAPRR